MAKTFSPAAFEVGSFNRGDRIPRKQKVFITLPAYDEGKGLDEMLASIRRLLSNQTFDYHVLVVDDGSQDDTVEVAIEAGNKMPVTVISHRENQGLAAAIRTGLANAVELSEHDDVILTMDADNTHPIGLIPRLVDKVNAGYDVVVASRFRKGSRVLGVPGYRQITSVGVAVLFKILFPIKGIRDYTCGFRAYRSSALRSTLTHYGENFVSEQGFSCMVDVLLKLSMRNLIMAEVPMILRYDLKEGASKMNVVSTIRDTLSLAIKRRLGVMN